MINLLWLLQLTPVAQIGEKVDKQKNIFLKPLLNIVVDWLNNSKTEQPDLSNHVQLNEKISKNKKNNETLSLSRYLWEL